MSDWKTGQLGSFIEFQRGLDIIESSHSVGTVPVVSSGGVSSYHGEAVSADTGVISRGRGALGKVLYGPGTFWPHDTTSCVRDFDGNHARLTSCFMTGFDVTWLDADSANPTLDRNHLHPVIVRWPPVHKQRVITGVSGALDDKIAVDMRVTQSFEELMRRESGAGA